MKLNDEQEFYELIRNISKGVKKHGVRKIIKTLKQLNLNNEDEVNYSIIDFVEKSVCSTIGVPIEELFSFNSRGEITIARKFCILLIRKYIPNISDEELGAHYNRSRQVVHIAEKEFRTASISNKNKLYKSFISLYADIDKQVSEFIKTLNTNERRSKKA